MHAIFTVALCSFFGGLFRRLHYARSIDTAFYRSAWYNGSCDDFAFVQTAMQRFTTAAKTAIIFAMEPVSAGVFGYFFAHELLSLTQMCGALLILEEC